MTDDGLDLTGWHLRNLESDPDSRRARALLRDPERRTALASIDGPDFWCSCKARTACIHVRALRQVARIARRHTRAYVPTREDIALDAALPRTEIIRRFDRGAEGRTRTSSGWVHARIARDGWSCTCARRGPQPCEHVRALRRLLVPPEPEEWTARRVMPSLQYDDDPPAAVADEPADEDVGAEPVHIGVHIDQVRARLGLGGTR